MGGTALPRRRGLLQTGLYSSAVVSTGLHWFVLVCREITCWASSRVGASTRAWVALRSSSICCRMEMAKVAVFPVPDCACAMTS